jgi:uncharacterized protein
VDGGSRMYVEKLVKALGADVKIHQGAGVEAVQNLPDGVRLRLRDGTSQDFAKVVIAAHGDQALAMLESPTELERDLLGKFRYQQNEAVLHTDTQFMPATRRCWAAWNYRIERGADGRPRHATHYWMNELQGVSEQQQYFVSINPGSPPAEKSIKRRLNYEHPIFDLPAVAAQDRLPELHKEGAATGRYFCGAWQRYGFHEDGLWSAVRACEAVLGENPWP